MDFMTTASISQLGISQPSHLDAIRVLRRYLDPKSLSNCVTAYKEEGDRISGYLSMLAALPDEVLELCIQSVDQLDSDLKHVFANSQVSTPSYKSPNNNRMPTPVSFTAIPHPGFDDSVHGPQGFDRDKDCSTPTSLLVPPTPPISKHALRNTSSATPIASNRPYAGVHKKRKPSTFIQRHCTGSQGTCNKAHKYYAHFEGHYRKEHLSEHTYSIDATSLIYSCCGQMYGGDGNALIKHVWDKHMPAVPSTTPTIFAIPGAATSSFRAFM